MIKLIESIKSVRLSKVIVVFLAGCMLLVSTACSTANTKVDPSKVSSQESRKYDAYDANQPKQGGMNGYNDDQRLDNPASSVKAKQLVDSAKRKDPIDSPQDYANEIKKGVNKLPEKVSRGAQDKVNDLKENLDNASKTAGRNLDRATDAVKDTIDDTSKAVKKAM